VQQHQLNAKDGDGDNRPHDLKKMPKHNAS